MDHLSMDKLSTLMLPLVRPKQAGRQGRYILLGEIEGLGGRVLLIDADFFTINTHLRMDEIEPYPHD